MPPMPREGSDHHPLAVGQFSHRHFSSDLHADHEEEHRHQRLVDPEAQIVGDREVPDVDRKGGRPEVEITVREGRVGPDQGCDGGQQQQSGTARFRRQELAHRLRDLSRKIPLALGRIRVMNRLCQVPIEPIGSTIPATRTAKAGASPSILYFSGLAG
jgi:hypothetical protein